MPQGRKRTRSTEEDGSGQGLHKKTKSRLQSSDNGEQVVAPASPASPASPAPASPAPASIAPASPPSQVAVAQPPPGEWLHPQWPQGSRYHRQVVDASELDEIAENMREEVHGPINYEEHVERRIRRNNLHIAQLNAQIEELGRQNNELRVEMQGRRIRQSVSNAVAPVMNAARRVSDSFEGARQNLAIPAEVLTRSAANTASRFGRGIVNSVENLGRATHQRAVMREIRRLRNTGDLTPEVALRNLRDANRLEATLLGGARRKARRSTTRRTNRTARRSARRTNRTARRSTTRRTNRTARRSARSSVGRVAKRNRRQA